MLFARDTWEMTVRIITTNENCHFNDHDFLGNGRCKWCDKFSVDYLWYIQYEKAERDGRTHGDHFHRTLLTRDKCTKEYRYVDPVEVWDE
jgi:hypothetical protein